MQATLPAGVEITGEITPQFAEILTPEALVSWRSLSANSARVAMQPYARDRSDKRASTLASCLTFFRPRRKSANRIGSVHRFRPTCSIAGLRSRDRPIAKW